MNIYVSSYDYAPKKWEGRVFMITEPLPKNLSVNYNLYRDKNIVFNVGMTTEKIKDKLSHINWKHFVSCLNDNDLFLGIESHIDIISEYLSEADDDVNILDYRDFLDMEKEIALYSLQDIKNSNYKLLLGYELSGKQTPITPIIQDGEYVPFVCDDGTIIIPDVCNDKYKWWKGGYSLKIIIDNILKPYIIDSMYRYLLTSYTSNGVENEGSANK